MTDRQNLQSSIEAYDWSTIEGVVCTDFAHAAQSLFGGAVYGFYDEDNPGTEPGKLCGGHDFLCVDDRYIIDVWLREVAGMSKQVIFDMQSEADKNAISKFYGDMSKWSVLPLPQTPRAAQGHRQGQQIREQQRTTPFQASEILGFSLVVSDLLCFRIPEVGVELRRFPQ